MALTGTLLSSLFYRDRAQRGERQAEVNVHCRRTIYSSIYLLLMDGANRRDKGGRCVEDLESAGAFWLNTNSIDVLFID